MTASLFSDVPTSPGVFLTVDGPNASGKTALVRALAARLTRTGHAVHTTRQPSPTPLGDLIRRNEQTYRGRALGCLVAGDRHHQVAAEIVPALHNGAIVLCDRYVESSLVLQRLDGLATDDILQLNAGVIRPDHRIRLLADPNVLRSRLASRGADTTRRFERDPGGPERELMLYDEADRFLTDSHCLPALVYDTTSTKVEALAHAILSTLGLDL